MSSLWITCEYCIGKVLETRGRNLYGSLFGPKKTLTTTNNYNQVSGLSGLDLSPRPAEYEVGLLTTRLGVFGIFFITTQFEKYYENRCVNVSFPILNSEMR